jgi:hypothetical protein
MSIYRSGFKLDVEAVAVFVRPSAADPGPESFAAFAVADMIGNVGWCFGSGLVVGGISHGEVSFFKLSGCANRGLMAQGGKSLLAGAKRNGQVGKLGATSRGNRFSDCADWRGLQCANQKGRVA